MKKGVVGKLTFAVIFLIFLSAGVFAAPPAPGTCKIVQRSECVASAGNIIIIGLSAATNAHGEYPDTGAYPYVLCCSFGAGNTNCTGGTPGNTIIGLSSASNAHAQSPLQTTYMNRVCYEDLKCITTTSSCNETRPIRPMEMISISDETNAHMGSINDYATKICCGSAAFQQCSLDSARWSIDKAIEGQKVRLEILGSGAECNGLKASFEVKEEDVGSSSPVSTNPLDVSFNGDTATGMWIAEWQDDGVAGGDPEYSFIGTLVRNPPLTIKSSAPLLTVSKVVKEDYCAEKETCSDYTIEEECESDDSLCNLAESSGLPEVDCNEEDILCGCSWSNETGSCDFSWSEIADCGSPETGCKYGCTLCSNDETGNYCSTGSSCPDGENPSDNQNGSCDFGEGCLSPNDCKNGDKDTCANGLFCSLGKCYSFEEIAYNSAVSLGGCKITQSIEKGCDEEPVGYKIITWTGRWSGNDTTGEPYEKCITGGRSTVSCAAQIQLPFFDYYELIVTVGVIVLIYISIMFRKKFLKKTHKKK